MQNSAVRISFHIWHSVKLVVGWEMCKILQQESLSLLTIVKLTKMGKRYSKFENSSRYLVLYEIHEFLFAVFYSCALPENLSGVSQKGSKFMCFWAEIHKLCVLLSVSHPLVMQSFPGVEICGFHLQKT